MVAVVASRALQGRKNGLKFQSTHQAWPDRVERVSSPCRRSVYAHVIPNLGEMPVAGFIIFIGVFPGRNIGAFQRVEIFYSRTPQEASRLGSDPGIIIFHLFNV
jgi:hypothetical protein